MSTLAPPLESLRRRIRPETSAWITLLLFFSVFCILVAVAGVVGWRSYVQATRSMESGLLRVHTNTGVLYRSEEKELFRAPRLSCAQVLPSSSNLCVQFAEGYQVQTIAGTGYGPVASLKLADQSQIDLWSHPFGADLTLATYRVSRWTNQRQEVTFRQNAGYARYDIANGQPFREIVYMVQIADGVRVFLEPGGSYSVNVVGKEAKSSYLRTISGEPMLAEVAVRSGRARVEHGLQGIVLEPDRKVQIGLKGAIGPMIGARWQLIDDGDFSSYGDHQHNGIAAVRWRQYGGAGAVGMTERERNGQFVVITSCRPETPNHCPNAKNQVTVGQFRREGNQSKTYITGVEQALDVDISEYSSLRLSAWVRVVTQTVELAGVEGSECPIMIQLVVRQTSPTDNENRRFICVYKANDPEDARIEEAGEITYHPVTPFRWERIDIELRDDKLFKQARYLQMITIEARGHDYISEITGVSLVGRH